MKRNLSVQKSLKETILFMSENLPSLIQLSAIPFFLMVTSSSLYVLNGGSIVHLPLLFPEIGGYNSDFIINQLSFENLLFLSYLVAYLLLARNLYEFATQKNGTQGWFKIFFDKKLALLSFYFLLFLFVFSLYFVLESIILHLNIISISHVMVVITQSFGFLAFAYLICRGAFVPFLSVVGSKNPLKSSFEVSRENVIQLFLFYVTSIFLAFLVSAGMLIPLSIPLFVLSFIDYFPLQWIGAAGLILLQCISLLFFEAAITVVPFIAYNQIFAKK